MYKYKVLVVEDEPDLRELIKEKLDKAGFDVSTAENGEDGFTKAKEVRPDVIISDVIMPGKDGNQLWKDLQQSDFGPDVPFIVLTARGGMRDYFEVVGVDDFIEKPFKPEELIEKINTAIERKGSLQGDPGKSPSPVMQKKESEGPEDIKISQESEVILKSSAIDIDTAKKQSHDIKETDTEKEHAQRAKISLGTGKKKIIVFGNDMDEFCELQRYFFKLDCASELVCALDECLQEAQRIRPDMIIIRDLPSVINGEESANQLRENLGLPEIPIIVYGNIGEREEAKKSSGERITTFSFNEQGKRLISKVRELLT